MESTHCLCVTLARAPCTLTGGHHRATTALSACVHVNSRECNNVHLPPAATRLAHASCGGSCGPRVKVTRNPLGWPQTTTGPGHTAPEFPNQAAKGNRLGLSGSRVCRKLLEALRTACWVTRDGYGSYHMQNVRAPGPVPVLTSSSVLSGSGFSSAAWI